MCTSTGTHISKPRDNFNDGKNKAEFPFVKICNTHTHLCVPSTQWRQIDTKYRSVEKIHIWVNAYANIIKEIFMNVFFSCYMEKVRRKAYSSTHHRIESSFVKWRDKVKLSHTITNEINCKRRVERKMYRVLSVLANLGKMDLKPQFIIAPIAQHVKHTHRHEQTNQIFSFSVSPLTRANEPLIANEAECGVCAFFSYSVHV